jgi:hypothetical protein
MGSDATVHSSIFELSMSAMGPGGVKTQEFEVSDENDILNFVIRIEWTCDLGT